MFCSSGEEKDIISKVMACISGVSVLDKHQSHSEEPPPPILPSHQHPQPPPPTRVVCLNNSLNVFLLWLRFRDGPLRAGVSVRAAHISSVLFV